MPNKKSQPFKTHHIEEDEVLAFRNTKSKHETDDQGQQDAPDPQEEDILVDDGSLETSEDEGDQNETAKPPQNWKRVVGTATLAIAMLAAGYWLGASGVFIKKQTINAPITNTPINNTNNPNSFLQTKTFTGVPISVVIDNQSDALPQRGLEKATIVWEVLAEGDITRYMAVFTDEIPEIVGPVRSARTYFNTLANQYGGLFLHVGGNDMALEEIKKGEFSFTDLNEFFNGSTFYRDKKRKAPHNVFTTRQQLESFSKSKNIPTTTITLFPVSEHHSGGNRVDALSIPYSQTHTDIIEWNGTAWIKKQNGTVLKDETGAPIPFDTVLLLSAQDETGFHPKIPELRRYLFNLGGDVTLLRDGISLNGTWRLSNNAVTIADENGNTLGTKPGRTLAILVPASVYSRITK